MCVVINITQMRISITCRINNLIIQTDVAYLTFLDTVFVHHVEMQLKSVQSHYLIEDFKVA